MNEQALDHAVEFIRTWLPLRYDDLEVPGFAVAVSHHGNILLNEAFGYADLERKTPLTRDHIFRIASHSKTFTATAIMLLAEEGRLRIDDRAADHLPWLKDHQDSRWSEVTLRQLLAHIGGVIRDGLNTDYWQLERAFPDAARFRNEMQTTPLVVDNNTKMKYSNYGYSLLGMVIEAVSGLPYNDFVTERIVRPLGLSHTHPEYSPAFEGELVTGYTRRQRQGRSPIAHISTHAMSAATGFCSTTADLCAYFTAHMAGSGQLLSDASKREMQRVHWHAKSPDGDAPDYGLGMILQDIGKRRVVGHSGGFPGHITRSAADPIDGLVVVALTNAIDGPASNIVEAIYKVIGYFQENTPADRPAHDLTALGGHYANLWGKTSIVVTGDKVVAVRPDSWEPFAACETLEYVDDTTQKVSDTSSFGSEDELVHWHLRDGRVETMDYTGSTMWPHAIWMANRHQRAVAAP